MLAQAQVSIAMGGGAALARTQADFVLLPENLEHLRDGLQLARRCSLAVVRQNLVWSFAYNFIACHWRCSASSRRGWPASACRAVPRWLFSTHCGCSAGRSDGESVPAHSLVGGAGFVIGIAFWWSVRSGQSTTWKVRPTEFSWMTTEVRPAPPDTPTAKPDAASQQPRSDD